MGLMTKGFHLPSSAPFLLDFRLNDVLFFFLLDFIGFWGRRTRKIQVGGTTTAA